MALISSLRPYVASYCPNVPDLVFEQAFRLTARDFFGKTLAWQVAKEFSISSGTNFFSLTPDDNTTDIDTVISIQIKDGKELVPTDSALNEMQAIRPTHFKSTRKGTVQIYPKPTQDTVLLTLISVKPKLTATTIDDSVFEQNESALINGTIAKLKQQPGTDWYAPNESNYYSSVYDDLVSEALLEASTGFNASESSIDFPIL